MMTAPMKRVRTRLSVTDAAVPRDMGCLAWGKDDLSSLEVRVTQLKAKLIQVSGEQFNYVLQTLKYPLLDHIVGNIQRVGMKSVLDSSLYEQFIVYIMQVNK